MLIVPRKRLQTSRRVLTFERGPLVMGVLNVTPDSFSDGGVHDGIDAALRRAEEMVEAGIAIIDVGGESSRPGSVRVPVFEECARTVPVVEAIVKRFDVPVSIDTSKADVARAAIDAGAEIINDISGLKFDDEMASVAARQGTGLVLMHLRGTFETMHTTEPVGDVVRDVIDGLKGSIETALGAGVEKDRISLDVGLGFSKTQEQNLELIGRLAEICDEFDGIPMLVGASRKSFIGKILGGLPADRRLTGTVAAHAVAAWNGADILRAHDVLEAVESLRVVSAIRFASGME